MVCLFETSLASIKEGMNGTVSNLLEQWTNSEMQALSTSSLADFADKYPDSTSKWLTKLMSSTTTCLTRAEATCEKIGVSPSAFTNDALPKLKSWSQTGLLVFTMGTAHKLIASRTAAKQAPATLEKAPVS